MTIRNAMVLAAGLGTRMRPITDTMPKPLVRIAGKPMIDYVLDCLAAAGVTKVVVNIHHFPNLMRDHLAGRKDVEILVSDETGRLMNSGGGLALGLKQLGRSPLFVMNADLFWVGEPEDQNSNLTRLAAFFDRRRMDMALLCVRLDQTTGHNGKNDFSMDPDGRLERFDPGKGSPVVYAGALVLEPGLLDDAPADPFNLNIYFDRAISNRRLYGTMLDGRWLTVGTPEAIDQAEDVLRQYRQGE
jgi:MurNAc alpha-1-phosphate uridylyltransferase